MSVTTIALADIENERIGLREKQKKRRFLAILEAARTLMCAKGYEGATLQAVADEAEIGVATVYNYFGTKRSLLFQLALHSTAQLDPVLGAWQINPDDNLEDTLVSWIGSVVVETLSVLESPIWSAVAAEAYRVGPTKGNETEDYQAISRRFVSYNARLVQRLKELAFVKEDLSDQDVAKLLDIVSTEVFRQALVSDSFDRATICTQARQLLVPLITGLR
jgi:AcrR family transcriptional regulator